MKLPRKRIGRMALFVQFEVLVCRLVGRNQFDVIAKQNPHEDREAETQQPYKRENDNVRNRVPKSASVSFVFEMPTHLNDAVQ